ncbi:carbamoyltransferase HypF [Hydrogenimonas cancrithermarum]|uniref:Carbamoyltransferase n=1 Tax=Hydrogenimonas cancrithermarum TaxID=2993563 RepID=A0ABN6WUG1_9BACT|nr:carbamoyltransferase HypF [Hydrogenimonas cancrithermarum]
MARSDSKQHLLLKIGGIVQGVGFRPFVHKLATELDLCGDIRNESDGVTIHIEGKKETIELFCRRLKSETPPLARIDTIESRWCDVEGIEGFSIVESDAAAFKTAAVSPDISVCENCVSEMRDPGNRRYRYPFINCTDCGPRYTITKTIPYDRPNTSMAKFVMCPTCKKEYENPLDRRYHAQPISCFECGPSLRLLHRREKWEAGSEESIGAVAQLLKEGKTVAVKGLGGFHLICDATNDEAVQRLRERKRRPSKPFAIMVKDVETAKKLARVDEMEERLLTSKERPIVLMEKTSPSSLPTPHLSDAVAPAIDRIGIMLPYTPLHLLLFDDLDIPLVATSANLGDEPIITDVQELIRKLGHVVDAVLDHDRDIVNACDDSVVQVIAGRPQWLRIARGVAPMTLPLEKRTGKKILAVGANQKNTIALAFEDKIILSPHIGDLNGIEAMEYFERTVETFTNFYGFVPDTIVHDKHPLYSTTKWASEAAMNDERLTIVEVQHHYAHTLAVMAEHSITDTVLAFSWDGTGYGDDGTIWGGEVLKADVHGFERVASLRPFRLLGGEKAVREPRRVALSLLFELFPLDEVLALKNPTVESFKPSEIKLLHQAWQKGINAPLTTSVGRLFDAVASLAGICQHISYEGESGLLLEARVSDVKKNVYGLPVKNGVIDFAPMIEELALASTPDAPAYFMRALCDCIVQIARQYVSLPLIFTGGVFQNRTLYNMVLEAFEEEEREILIPEKIPVNDASIALGQAWYAFHREEK